MDNWKPIAEAGKIPKGKMRIYSFEPSVGRVITLDRINSFDRNFGNRVCDQYIDIPFPERSGK